MCLFIHAHGLIPSFGVSILKDTCERMKLTVKLPNQVFRRLFHSRVALALPVTFLILLVSSLTIIAATYAFAVERVNSQSETLQVSNAKENFRSLDDVILSTLLQAGSAGTIELADCGGQINVQPTSNVLTLGISDNSDIQETIFNMSVGKVTYELPYSSSSETGLYLKGDSRTITNQSGSSTSQLCIASGAEHAEIQLRYRPTVSYAAGGLESGKAVNNIRIYVVNLNSSDPIDWGGELPLKICCASTQLSTKTYSISYQPENLAVTSALDGANGSVTLPLSSTSQGSIINLEIVVSNVSIERWIR
jgi:hypothetical protein